jgi:transcriptional regulator with XRE-family HTH domain
LEVIGKGAGPGYRHAMALSVTIGDHLRTWRLHRRLSQLDLALEANISARHLSFVETGRAQPSRMMILHLCEQLQVPLRERNLLLLSAGFAPIFPERALEDPALRAAREAIELVLGGHEPYPALAIGEVVSDQQHAHAVRWSSRCKRSRISSWIVTSSAVVGSSEISTGPQASAIAIMTRSRMLPLSR